MTGRLDGRVVLITGSSGIAAATAVRAAADGASVFVVSRTGDHAQALAERLPTAGWAEADLRDEPAVDAAVTEVVERFGRIDSVFSAAGGSGRPFGDGPIHAMTAGAWDQTLALNLRSHALVASRVIRVMRDQPVDSDGSRGSILFLGTVLATHPVPEYFATHAYAARKQPLAGALLDPDDVARAALFFLSPASRAVTGQSLAVDGGWSIVSTSAGEPSSAEPTA